MEQNLSNEVAEHEAARKRKLKKKRIRKIIILSVLAVVLVAGGFIAYKALSLTKESDKAGIMRYRFADISEGEINTTISGSGTLSAKKATTITAIADGTVEEICKQPGDTVAKDEPILKISSKALGDELATLYSSLQSVQKKMSGTTRDRNNKNINAPQAGLIKEITVSSGDAVDSVNYLCRISTDKKMKAVIDVADGLSKYSEVTVEIGGTSISGIVDDIIDGKAHIVFDDAGYSVGTPVNIRFNGRSVPGTVECNENVVVTATTGAVDEVKVTDNQSVRKNETIFTLKDGAMTDQYKKYYDQEQSYLEQIQDIEDALTVKSDLNGLLAALSVEEGDEISSGSSLCILTSTDAYTMTLGIDELDIASVAIGQDVKITLDALEGEYPGKVTNISYSGSGNYVTTYTATITCDPIEGALPGMSGDAEIITETSGTSMIVPVAAVQYEGPDTYILLAKDFDESQDVSDTEPFTRIPVKTGMSDGSYIVIESNACKAGDRICVPGMETTAVYDPNEDNPYAAWANMRRNSMGSDRSSRDRNSDMPMNGNMPNGGMPGGGPGNRPGEFGG